MMPVTALLFAAALQTGQGIEQIVPTFNPVITSLPNPSKEGQRTLCMVGQLFTLTRDGDYATADGDLYVLLEPLKVQAGPEPEAEVFHFDTAALTKLRTKDERFGDCYTVAIPWPKDWAEVTQLRVSTKFEPTANWQPTIIGTPQTILVDYETTKDAKRTDLVRCCTSNFEVHAPDDKLAAQVAKAAEKHRKELAEKWLGKELPAWEERCPIAIRLNEKRTGGATTFTFAAKDPAVAGMEMSLFGTSKMVLENVLPHEITHSVIATAIGKPVPRWVDEGIGVLAESTDEQAAHDQKCHEFLAAGRGYRLKYLFDAKDYPRDVIVLFAQGHSVCRFLLTRKLRMKEGSMSPEKGLVKFTTLGMEVGWDEAMRVVYGFENVNELEEAWLAWLHMPESVLGAAKSQEKAKSMVDEYHIPPTKLPK